MFLFNCLAILPHHFHIRNCLTLFFQNAHNNRVRKSDIVTDMAQDALERSSLTSLAKEKELMCGIVRRSVVLRDAALAKKLGRERGTYVTYDCPSSALSSERGIKALERYISETLVELLGVQGRRDGVLVVGLGNDEVTADSLGGKTVKLLDVSPPSEAERERVKTRLFAFATGVESATGMRSADAVAGICSALSPSAVIVVDSLATAVVGRIGASFQLTTAGISPGSGVGGDKPRIDRGVLGVPVVAVGVPTVLSMRTVLADFAGEYTTALGCAKDEFKLRSVMAERKLSSLVVAPKEVGYYVESAAAIVAGAINRAFGEHS